MIKEIIKALGLYGGQWSNNGNIWTLSKIIAERRILFSKKKLTYSAKFQINDSVKSVVFSEMLVETSSGFDAGFGFKAETYNTVGATRSGSIEEQSSFFGKNYQYKFNYQEIREKVEKLVGSLGYKFEYKILI